jgi:hypothetical protein
MWRKGRDRAENAVVIRWSAASLIHKLSLSYFGVDSATLKNTASPASTPFCRHNLVSLLLGFTTILSVHTTVI